MGHTSWRGLWNAQHPVYIKGIKKKGSAPLEWQSPLDPRVSAGGGNLAVGAAGARGLPDGGDRMVPPGHHHGEGGGVERETNFTLPSYLWVRGRRPNSRILLRGKWLRLCCVCLG